MFGKYQRFIEERFLVLNSTRSNPGVEEQKEVPFKLNKIQTHFLSNASAKAVVLKARQQGFSSLILAMFTADFILKENTLSVVVADVADNASDLLSRVKNYIKSYEQITNVKIPLKYNSRKELQNLSNNSRYIIGTAENSNFGRSKTVSNLHLSEGAFYKDFDKILASAGTALAPGGKFFIETTANGFNEFKTFWDNSELDRTGFMPLFYPAKNFYPKEFLEQERLRLGRLYEQEYPDSAEEAFLTSGEMYFNREALREYLKLARDPVDVSALPSV